MSSLNIHFLDVGQGDGVYVKFPTGAKMIIDMGSRKSKDAALAVMPQFFTSQDGPAFKTGNNYNSLDYLVITHADEDHYNLIVDFLKGFKVLVRNLYFGGYKDDYTLKKENHIDLLIESQKELRKSLPNSKPMNVKSNIHGNLSLPCQIASFNVNGEPECELWMLACNTGTVSSVNPTDSSGHAKNTRSIVLQIKYGTVNVMLTGDATTATEEALIAKCKSPIGKINWDGKLKSAVWKVQHHGSARTSVSDDWLTKVQPEYAFIMSDMHGSNKLPQDFCIDKILKKASIKSYTTVDHDYVSYYDPKDWGNSGTAGWAARTTKKAVHSSIAQMKNGNVDDPIGVRVDVYVYDDGTIAVDDTGLDPNAGLRKFA